MVYLFTDIFIISSGKQRYKRGFVKKKKPKNRAIKLKIQEKHMTLTSSLMFSPEFNLERELCITSVLSNQI